jgi:hypothetical protein
MALWIELLDEFETAFERGDRASVARILAYARHCWGSRSAEVVTAVMLAFFEHLPLHATIRASLPQLISRDEFTRLKAVFARHCDDDGVRELERAFR